MGASWVDLNSQDSVVPGVVTAVSEHLESSLLADFHPSSSHCEEESEEGKRRRASFGGRSGLLCEHVGSVWPVSSQVWEVNNNIFTRQSRLFTWEGSEKFCEELFRECCCTLGAGGPVSVAVAWLCCNKARMV